MTRPLSIALFAATLSATDQTLTISEHELATRAWKCGMIEVPRTIPGLDPEVVKILNAAWRVSGCASLRREITGKDER